MKSIYLALLGSGLLATSAVVGSITIDTVFVGDAGNANDSTGWGGVSYEYYIGTYEVTNAQYATFLNSVDPNGSNPFGIYNGNMGSNTRSGGISYNAGAPKGARYSVKIGFENKPVNYVSFWDAARFTNWLSTGNTEKGVYALGGVATPKNDTIIRDATAWENGGVAVASENEWYKAAYYSGSPTGADGDGYWLFPTQSNTINKAVANYDNRFGAPTAVGNYSTSPSHYGTFDQGGNVGEWSDDIIGTSQRVESGGSWYSGVANLQSSFRSGVYIPTAENDAIGFRVSSLSGPDIVPVPEPSTYAAIVVGLGLLMALMRRKGRRTLKA